MSDPLEVAGRATERRTSQRRSRSRRHRPWWRRKRTWLLGIPALVLLLVLGWLWQLNHLLAGVRRAPLLSEYDGPAGQGTNLLVVESGQKPGMLRPDQASLVVQLVHFSDDFSSAAVVHFPRNLALKGGPAQRIDRIWARGGAPLMVRTLQSRLGLRIDHVAQVALTGYQEATDLIGGVTLQSTPLTGGGPTRHVTGAEARAWAEQRDHLTYADIETGRRHQEWQRAMLVGALRPRVVLNPITVTRLVSALTHNLVVDDTLTTSALRSLVWHSKNLRPGNIRYLTVPVGPAAPTRPVRATIHPDAERLGGLSLALSTDNTSAIAGYDN